MIQHTLVIIVHNVVFYGMIWHTIVITVQNVVFLWFDIAYHSNYNAKFVFYDMIQHTLVIITQTLVHRGTVCLF